MTSLAWSFILSPRSTKNTRILYLFRQFCQKGPRNHFCRRFKVVKRPQRQVINIPILAGSY